MRLNCVRLVLSVFVTTVFASSVNSSAADSPARPNIVFILADDLGFGDLGCYGQEKIKTPNIDRLAAEGIRLTQHYCGNAVCAPSRCVLMTGMHPGHALVRNNREVKPEGQWPIPAGTVTLPRLLQQAGYVTGGFGKWGLGGPDSDGRPLRQGFDRFFGYNCQRVAHNFYPTYLWDNDRRFPLNNPDFSPHGKLEPGEDPNDPRSYARFQGREYSADIIAAQALEFVKANRSRPFFLYWPTTVPHLALQVPDDSVKEYEGLWDDPPYVGGNGYTPHIRPRAGYAGMVTRMDREIGKLIKLIEEFGLENNTIYVFASDNGPLYNRLGGTDSDFFNSHRGLRGRKGSLYEGGFRSPGIVRWPGKIKPGINDRVTGFEDWLPTLLELAGLRDATPSNIDGISFAATLLGGQQPERPFLYREFPSYGGQQIVRVGPWKAVKQGLAPRGKGADKSAPTKGAPVKTELYNLADDPTESIDVADKHPDMVAKLEQLMRQQHTPNPDFPLPGVDE